MSVTSVTHGAIYDTTDGEEGRQWDLWDKNTLSFKRIDTATKGDRQKGGWGGEEGGDVVHTAQLSLAQVDIRHPLSFSV